MLDLVRHKFEHPMLRAQLEATGERPLLELNTWGDRIWGVTESAGTLTGANALGQILMAVRAENRAGGSISPRPAPVAPPTQKSE